MRLPTRIIFALLLVALAGALGCASSPSPPPPVTRTKPAETPAAQQPPATSETTPTPLPPSSAPPDPAPASKSPGSLSGAVDVVDPGGDKGPVSLVQAAKAERERRSHAGEPVVVITDKSLPNLPKGQVTYAKPGQKAPAKLDDKAAEAARDEQYWRGRAVEIRTRWRDAADAVKDLEQSAAGWRRRFYAENDPSVRDSQVKPEWDRVLDRLGRARAEVEAAKKELEGFLEEGRRAGALPGWLREGAEREPVAEKKSKEPGTLESKEPAIYHQQQDKPPGDGGAGR